METTKLFLGSVKEITPENDNSHILDIEYQPQGYKNWCWAACGTMLHNLKYSQSIEIEAFANLFLGANVKCDIQERINKRTCNKTIPENQIKSVFSEVLSNSENVHTDEISSGNILSSLKEKKPLMIGIEFNSSDTGHLVLIKGIEIINNNTYLIVSDPARGNNVRVLHQEMYSNYGQGGKWEKTWV